MGNTRARRSKVRAMPPAAVEQFSFDFPPQLSAPPELQATAVAQQEILPPTTRLEPTHEVLPPPISEGQREHKFFVHQADKYESRTIRAEKYFFGTAALAILAKAGVPVAEMVLPKGALTGVEHLLLVAGILGGLAVILAGRLFQCAVTAHHYRMQLQLPLGRPSALGRFVQGLHVFEAALVVSVLGAVVIITYADMYYVFTFVWARIFGIPNGWEP